LKFINQINNKKAPEVQGSFDQLSEIY